MTIQLSFSTRSQAYTAISGQTAFPVPFPVLSAADLTVTQIPAGTTERTTLTLGSAYVVTGASQQSGAQVALSTPANTGDVILIEGALTPQRQTAYTQGPIVSGALDNDFNALEISVQELRRDVNRAIRRTGEDPNLAANVLLPDGAVNAVVAFDASGNIVAVPQSALGGGEALAIGTVTTGAPGSSAAASITSGTLNLTIPQGAAGATGATGPTGPAGSGGGAAQVNSDWNASTGVAQILNKPTIPAAQVNCDWNASAASRRS